MIILSKLLTNDTDVANLVYRYIQVSMGQNNIEQVYLASHYQRMCSNLTWYHLTLWPSASLSIVNTDKLLKK